tara:strand:- start:2023 stop:3147 length:1125 start_codon:yes stop_codon:yes gene_type:complete
MNSFIPVNQPSLDGNEKKYVNECLDTGWISSEGPFVERFEHEMAALHGVKYGVSVSNGTAALELAFGALGLIEGDEVILPSFTIISCLRAVLLTGAKPILVDSDPYTWNMSIDEIVQKITPNTKCILAVHIYGLPVEIKSLIKIAKDKGIVVIEDVAEAIGLKYNGNLCGSFGDMSIYSFYPNKHITTGEGGMVLTNNKKYADYIKLYRNICFIPEKRFYHEDLAPNYRMTNIQAALGLAQLEKLNATVTKKRFIGELYQDLLRDFLEIQLPLSKTPNSENIYWVFGITLNPEVKHNNEYFIKEFAKNNIGTRLFFWPMHEQPISKKMDLFINESYPVSEKLGRRGFYLPSGLTITENEIMTVVKTFKNLLEKA